MRILDQIAFLLICVFLVPLLLYAVWFAIAGFFRDCFGALWRTPAPPAPPDWHALEKGELPTISDEEAQRQKDRFAKSCEIHGECIPRTSHYGLIGRPLRREE